MNSISSIHIVCTRCELNTRLKFRFTENSYEALNNNVSNELETIHTLPRNYIRIGTWNIQSINKNPLRTYKRTCMVDTNLAEKLFKVS